MSAPWRPTPEVVPGTPSHRLIRGVMRMDVEPLHVERVVLYRTPECAISLVDTGNGDAAPWATGGDTTVHMLWQMDEDDAWIEVERHRHPIAPGDTMSIPGGAKIGLANGMLLIRIDRCDRSLGDVLPPSHGVDAFEGYNRRTDYETPAGFSLERWKITRPLTLPAADRALAVVDLAQPLALMWPRGTDLIGRGECRVVEPGTGPITLLPDGLGYALVVGSRGK